MSFWEDSARPLLLERGYTLYNHYCLNETTIGRAGCGPYLPNLSPLGGQFPYAFHDEWYASFEEDTGDIPYLAHAWVRTLLLAYENEVTALIQQGHVVFAQDKEHRHVAMKLVRRESEESRIMHLLFQAQTEKPDQYIPGIVPILEILPFAGHWLVVMPR